MCSRSRREERRDDVSMGNSFKSIGNTSAFILSERRHHWSRRVARSDFVLKGSQVLLC